MITPHFDVVNIGWHFFLQGYQCLSSRAQRFVISLSFYHRRKPFISRTYPPVVPITDEISRWGFSVPPLSFFLCRTFHRWVPPSYVPTCFHTLHCHGSVRRRYSCTGECSNRLSVSLASVLCSPVRVDNSFPELRIWMDCVMKCPFT